MKVELDVRRVAERLSAADAPLEPNAVAACAAHDGDPADASRLRADPEAALLLRVLEEDARRGTRLVFGVGAVAAAVLVAVLLLWHDGSQPVDKALDVRLAAVGAELQEAEPDLFGDFEPRALDPVDETAPVRRGGGRWIAPRGTVLDAPRRLVWSNPAGATRVEVRLRGDGFTWSETVAGEAVDAPELTPGRYVVTVRALDALAGQTIKRSFAVADADQRALFDRARDVLTSRCPVDVTDLMEAYYALHAGYLDAAEAAAMRAATRGGDVAEQAERILAQLRRAP